MKYAVRETGRSLYSLLCFVFWYALGTAFLFYVLPQAGAFLQSEYESLNTSVRVSMLAVSGVLIAAALFKAFRLRSLP